MIFHFIQQVGQQNLPFGLKFNAKGFLDCYEKDLEIFPTGKKRDIDFKMIEGDFQLFEGKWSIEQVRYCCLQIIFKIFLLKLLICPNMHSNPAG